LNYFNNEFHKISRRISKINRSELDLILGIHDETNTYIANKEVGYEVKAGEIMAPAELGSNVRLGNNLLSIGEYSSAIKTFDVIIKNSTDDELTSIAWNNKAQCFRMLSRHRDELSCINMALKYKKDGRYLSNKILCLESLGRKKEIEIVKEQLAKLQNK
jgi:tetratricopeptide (TPR) repeat protein